MIVGYKGFLILNYFEKAHAAKFCINALAGCLWIEDLTLERMYKLWKIFRTKDIHMGIMD